MCSASVCVWNSSKCSNVNIFGPFGSWLLAGTGRTQTCKQSNLLSARLLPRHFAPECAHIMWNISWAHAATTGTTKTKKRKKLLNLSFCHIALQYKLHTLLLSPLDCRSKLRTDALRFCLYFRFYFHIEYDHVRDAPTADRRSFNR